MALALRPLESPTSMASPYGSQALAEGLRSGFGSGLGSLPPADSAPESGVTSSASLAGFAGVESGVTSPAGFGSSGSVVTPAGRLAGFADNCRPRGGRSSTPISFK